MISWNIVLLKVTATQVHSINFLSFKYYSNELKALYGFLFEVYSSNFEVADLDVKLQSKKLLFLTQRSYPCYWSGWRWQNFSGILYVAMMLNNLFFLNGTCPPLQLFLTSLQFFYFFLGDLVHRFIKQAYRAARNRYQQGLPDKYSLSLHQKQVKWGVIVRSTHCPQLSAARATLLKLGCGSFLHKFVGKLEEDCNRIWKNVYLTISHTISHVQGRQKCDLLSLTGRICSADFVNGEHIHDSQYRSLAACNCGANRAIRNDPFDLKVCTINATSRLKETIGSQ